MAPSMKKALVTGASRGIGRAIAGALAREGFDLLVTARSVDALDSLAQELRGLGREVRVIPGDLRLPAFPAHLLAALEGSPLDLLVNVAGATPRGPFLELSDADWEDGFALKLFGAVRLCRVAWPRLVAARGQVVNIIGSGGRTPSADFTIGGAVNAGLMNFTKALADLGLKDGVRVNGINPGPIRTGRLEARLERIAGAEGISKEAAAARLVAAQRVMRFGAPEEIAAMVVFLAAGGGTFLHGALVDVDGGATKGL